MSEPPAKPLRCEASYQGDQIRFGMGLFGGFTSIGDTPLEKLTYQVRALANDIRCIWREWRYWRRFHSFRRVK